MADLETIALALPGVDKGIACAGTALESSTYRTTKKAFLFVAKKDARLKLDASASEAKKLGFAIGANGWVTLPLDALPSALILKRWVAESHEWAVSGRKAQTRKATKSKTSRKKR